MAETLSLSHSAGVTGSWRDTLFVWCGKISIEATKNDDDDDDKTKDGKKDGDKTFITWTGSWVGVDSATADSSTEIERSTSKNTFTVKGNQFSRSNSITLSTTEYLLDNGDGLEAHIDPSYEICVKEREDGSQLVAGAGCNEFGKFISVGTWKGNELILARRYVEDGDVRSFMTCQDVMEELDLLKVDVMGLMPWRDRVCRCEFYKPSQEQKDMFKERKRRKKFTYL